jgi:uncharacterized membrane protein (UPF0127 family)
LFAGVPLHAAGDSTLEIVSKSGVHAFSFELAATEAERSRGLMFRKELPEGHGMLFDFEKDQPVSFWMHNTYISLDMIFITGDGRIVRIAENTEPLSDRLIPSGAPIRAVLEVIAGTARKFGIAPGDRRPSLSAATPTLRPKQHSAPKSFKAARSCRKRPKHVSTRKPGGV